MTIQLFDSATRSVRPFTPLHDGEVRIYDCGPTVYSNQLIARTMVEAARARVPGFPEHSIQVVPTPDRQAIPLLLSLTQYIDLCMPRGGEGLIRAVAECSKVPVIKHYKGVCHGELLFKTRLEGTRHPDLPRDRRGYHPGR